MDKLKEIQKEFFDHMQICGVCNVVFDRCWRMDEICKELVRAGLFRRDFSIELKEVF